MYFVHVNTKLLTFIQSNEQSDAKQKTSHVTWT